MRHAIPLMLETDTVEHVDWFAKQLARQRNRDVSRSEAIEYIVARHWRKTAVRAVAAKIDRAKASLKCL